MTEETKYREVPFDSPKYHAALRLRTAVLRTPLGLEFTAEEVAAEPRCHHFVAIENGAVVATLLLVPLDAATMKMRQVAVQPARQGGGIGAGLVGFAEAWARERGFRKIVAHARGTAVDFYRRLNYTVEGEPFLECTIPHQLVSKTL